MNRVAWGLLPLLLVGCGVSSDAGDAEPRPSPVVSASPSAVPTQTPTLIPSTVPSATPTLSPSPSPSLPPPPVTATPSPSAAPGVSSTPAPSSRPQPTDVPVPTTVVTASPQPSSSPTPIVTASPSVAPSPTATASPTPTVQPTGSVTATPTQAPSPTATVTPSASPSPSVSPSPTSSVSPTPTVSPSPTATPTATPVVTPTPVLPLGLRVGASKRSVAPVQEHVAGVAEPRLFVAEHQQRFNLGGFGIDPLQNFPDPIGAQGDALTQPAEGTHLDVPAQGGNPAFMEEIWVRAMYMAERDATGNETAILFITLDSVGAGNIIQDGLKATVSQLTGVPEQNILFGQSHSHAGPDLQGLWGGVPQDWIQNVLYQQAALAALEARDDARLADLRLRSTRSSLFNNYRRPRLDPDADADDQLRVLEAVVSGGTDIIASLLQYSAHPTSINEDPRLPHADYILGVVDQLEARNGGVGLYFNGPIADASPSGSRPGCDPLDRYPAELRDYGSVHCRGEGIAEQALAVGAKALDGSLSIRNATAYLPVTNPLFVGAGLIGSFNRYYDFVEAPVGLIPGVGGELQNGLYQLPQAAPYAVTPVTRITIGGADNGLEIVTIPGETTNSYGQFIRSLAAPGAEVMLFGLTQNSFGYILPEDEFSYIDTSGGTGLALPYTGYEEFVSLGPLTAPLLQLQAYLPLFDVPPGADYLPASLRACADPMAEACIVNRMAARLEPFQRNLAEQCLDNFGQEAFCALLNPDTPLRAVCDGLGFPPTTCAAFGGPVDGPGAPSASAELLLSQGLLSTAAGCDPLDPAHCLYPFPSDHFTVEAPDSGLFNLHTGRKVQINPLATPRNLVGKPIDPREWNRNDGFAPGAVIMTLVPGLSLEQTHGTDAGGIGIGDLRLSLTAESTAQGWGAPPILLLEVADEGTGASQEHIHWAEMDVNAGLLLPTSELQGEDLTRPDARVSLLIRPGRNLTPGKRYVVVLRNLRDADGLPLSAQPGFAACKAGGEYPLPSIANRCTQLEQKVWPVLDAAGIARDDSLYLAWDFTVASAQNITGRLVHMRDEGFRTLANDAGPLGGGSDCSELRPDNLSSCRSPQFTVDTIDTGADNGRMVSIAGSLTVPSFLFTQDPSPLDNAAARAVLEQLTALGGEQAPSLVNNELYTILESGSVLPPNRLHYQPDGSIDPSLVGAELAAYGDGLPDRLPILGEMSTRYVCEIPKQAWEAAGQAARASLYGHGLLQSRGAITYDGNRNLARPYNIMLCALDWFGFAQGDLPNIATALLDFSNFPVVPDASQQGMLNWMFLARAMEHPQGFASHPAFHVQGDLSQPLAFDRREVFYYGNSQGGILPGPVVAVSKDINRGVFGVPGMNYSTLLRRSSDFGLYSVPLYLSYPDELDRNLIFGLMPMLWNRGENDGFAAYLTPADGAVHGGLPGDANLDGQDNQVLLHTAFGDHQVTMWSADVMSRTANLPTDSRDVCGETADRSNCPNHPDRHPYVELPELGYSNQRAEGGAQVVWYRSDVIAPPLIEIPPHEGPDPHGYPRSTGRSICQMNHFLQIDGFIADTRALPDDRDQAVLACRQQFGDVPTLQEPGQGGPLSLVEGRGGGLLGAMADAGANLHEVLTAALDSNPTGAAEAAQRAAQDLADALSSGGDPTQPEVSILGLDAPLTVAAARALSTARDAAPVVLTGRQLPGWSLPEARGVAHPYPSGAIISGELFDAFNAFGDYFPPGQIRDAHNGTILYPLPGTPAAQGHVDVDSIAAYRWDTVQGGFVEIPVQVDERAPYFLANANSDFSVYSGTDPELSYVWENADSHSWGFESWMMVGGVCEREYPPSLGPVPDPVAGLDDDDEIVFMASDAGPPAAALAFPGDWQAVQMVHVIDPLNPAALRVVYLVRKPGGSSFTAASGYVDYQREEDADQWIDRSLFTSDDPEKLGTSNTGYGANLSGTVCPDGTAASQKPSSDRFPRDGITVQTETYRFQASGRWMKRDLRIRPPEAAISNPADWDSRPDLIDRWKGRAFQQSPDSVISLVGFEDEQVNWEANSALIGERCGPVRCLREVWGADSGTNVTKTEAFYRDLITYQYRVRVHPIPPDGLYTSWDYNREAMLPTAVEQLAGVQAGRYYTALRPQGVPIDGINDDFGNVDGYAPLPILECVGDGGPQPPASSGRCPAFFDAADPTFNVPLAFDNWEQVSGKGDSGSLVYSFELVGLTSLANPLVVPYYRDDACLDDGTGDNPVPRPFPGESYDWSNGAVRAAYDAEAGRALDYSGQNFVDCTARQGAHGSHGVHYFVTHDSDNAFSPLATTEIDARQWQFIVPSAQPRNLGEPYANNVRVPLVVQGIPLSLP